jgi:hypothetical protein
MWTGLMKLMIGLVNMKMNFAFQKRHTVLQAE